MSGGRRDNAGRKRIAPEERRVPLTFSVHPSTLDKARELRNIGYQLNREIEREICDRWEREKGAI